ncbi:MAG: tyrosine-type recombinase/integrase [Deltaproteobacteria bacterium]|nr:tyrosine-type recombinase/integrase [Deltaproteobacteria bacterium]
MSPSFPALVQSFFCERLLAQRNASPCTVAAYRDTFRLLLCYVRSHHHTAPTALTLQDLDAPLVLAFLDHLERDRHNTIRSRNARLVALRSFFHYAAGRDPANLPTIQRVLAIPSKRCDTPLLGFLTREEVAAVQATLDLTTWSGRRDQALFATLYNTGARVSEAIDLRVADFVGGREATLHLRGKGRKERVVPLWKSTARLLSSWLATRPSSPAAPLFPNRGDQRMSRSGVAHRLRLAVTKAAATFPSLRGRRISPHTLRHTTAMHLLQAGVDLTVIALWLGHESPTTTHRYVEADLAMKRRALAALTEPTPRDARFTPSDDLLAFLEGL